MKRRDVTSNRGTEVWAAVLCLASVALGWVMTNKWYPLSLMLVPVIGLAVFRLISLQRETKRRVGFMFNAVDNDDFTFRFHEQVDGREDLLLNASLNRIKDILMRAKLRAMERERYYQLIMERARTGLVVIDDQGSVYQVNGEALRILGLQRFTHIRQTQNVAPELCAVLRDIRPGRRYRAKCQSETGERILMLDCSEIELDQKRLRVVVVGDIENEQSEMQIESWSKLTRILTHEIMNSLSPITSLSDTLLHVDGPLDTDVRHGLETINVTGRRLIAFVEHFRRFTRIPEPNKEPFEVRPWIERSVRLTVPEGIDARIAVSPADMLVYADPMLAGQVIVNLLKNAVEAVREHGAGSIEVRAAIDAEENVLVHVSNDAGAIPAETVDNIFTPFFTTKTDGSGIGLSVSRRIMQLHEGALRLTSNSPQRVTFTMIFR